MSVRSVSPRREVFQSATPADRTSRRSSSVVRARVCVHACMQAWRNALRVAIVRARACVPASMRAWRDALRVARRNGRPKRGFATLNKKKALRACCEAERAEGGESGACALA